MSPPFSFFSLALCVTPLYRRRAKLGHPKQAILYFILRGDFGSRRRFGSVGGNTGLSRAREKALPPAPRAASVREYVRGPGIPARAPQGGSPTLIRNSPTICPPVKRNVWRKSFSSTPPPSAGDVQPARLRTSHIVVPQCLEASGIFGGGIDLEPVTDDPRVGQQAVDLCRAEGGDAIDCKIRKGGAKPGALFKDRRPGETTWLISNISRSNSTLSSWLGNPYSVSW